jgi:hypothetical protein
MNDRTACSATSASGLRGAACRRCARGSAPPLRGGKPGTFAFDEINPTLIVLDQRSGAGQSPAEYFQATRWTLPQETRSEPKGDGQ